MKQQVTSNKQQVNKRILIKKIFEKEINFHQLSVEMKESEKAEIRREALEKIEGVNLEGVGDYAFDPETAGKRNCENLIGGVSVPLGVAGPIKINGQFAKGEFYLPLATTEGALIASVNRGCKAITTSGGCIVQAVDVGMTRAPVFIVSSKRKTQNSKPKLKTQIQKSMVFIHWVGDNFSLIKNICEETSSHLKLLEIEPITEDEAVFLRFRFNTGLAMGMNMATIATSAACEFIEKETGAKLAALSGNVCCDKKASRINFEKGRGKKVNARVVLTKEILENDLKTTAKEFYEVYRLKILLGSQVAGTIGANAQMANVLAAIFLATGQDIAHVAEAAIGETKCSLCGEDLEINVYLPDLPIGVIGGGTGLLAQRESLGILGVSGKSGNDCLKLAEIIGGAVLAGEISLLAALASGDLARAHARLGRGKKEHN